MATKTRNYRQTDRWKTTEIRINGISANNIVAECKPRGPRSVMQVAPRGAVFADLALRVYNLNTRLANTPTVPLSAWHSTQPSDSRETGGRQFKITDLLYYHSIAVIG
ncbi:hypothetical protein J6590_059126 [Homalodisca vitripennis]|nr:hypothetical protein J6590_059126 [Homalodisca vitripennis]